MIVGRIHLYNYNYFAKIYIYFIYKMIEKFIKIKKFVENIHILQKLLKYYTSILKIL